MTQNSIQCFELEMYIMFVWLVLFCSEADKKRKEGTECESQPAQT